MVNLRFIQRLLSWVGQNLIPFSETLARAYALLLFRVDRYMKHEGKQTPKRKQGSPNGCLAGGLGCRVLRYPIPTNRRKELVKPRPVTPPFTYVRDFVTIETILRALTY